jgi:hypothetical protein
MAMKEEARPRYGRRAVDHSNRAKINAWISELKAIIMVAVFLFGAAGLRVAWIPGERLNTVEAKVDRNAEMTLAVHDTLRAKISGLDSANIAEAVIMNGMARYMCLTTPQRDLQLLNLPCSRLLRGGSLLKPED